MSWVSLIECVMKLMTAGVKLPDDWADKDAVKTYLSGVTDEVAELIVLIVIAAQADDDKLMAEDIDALVRQTVLLGGEEFDYSDITKIIELIKAIIDLIRGWRNN